MALKESAKKKGKKYLYYKKSFLLQIKRKQNYQAIYNLDMFPAEFC